jgi:hypothetical protein
MTLASQIISRNSDHLDLTLRLGSEVVRFHNILNNDTTKFFREGHHFRPLAEMDPTERTKALLKTAVGQMEEDIVARVEVQESFEPKTAEDVDTTPVVDYLLTGAKARDATGFFQRSEKHHKADKRGDGTFVSVPNRLNPRQWVGFIATEDTKEKAIVAVTFDGVDGPETLIVGHMTHSLIEIDGKKVQTWHPDTLKIWKNLVTYRIRQGRVTTVMDWNMSPDECLRVAQETFPTLVFQIVGNGWLTPHPTHITDKGDKVAFDTFLIASKK